MNALVFVAFVVTRPTYVGLIATGSSNKKFMLHTE